jgi:N-acyl-D-amino-acid deacylase
MSDLYDTIIRAGLVVDGSGDEPRIADVAIRQGTIVDVAPSIQGRADNEIDAAGFIVTPGFIDIHTHYDGQATWEHQLAPSSEHGVTTVVMGNCGVGFAPCKPDQRDMLVSLMEGVEDIPEIVMTEGLRWNWRTFPDYLDVLDARAYDIDIAAQVPHSALRVYVMGKRGADHQPPTTADLAEMRSLTSEAVRAGALGVTTSRSLSHRARDGKLAPSVSTDEAELMALAGGLKDAGAGVFQLLGDIGAPAEDEFALVRRLARYSSRPISFPLLQFDDKPDDWKPILDRIDDAANEGLAIRGQVFPRAVGVLYGLDLSLHPFALHPSFQPLADLPLAEKVRALRDPQLRRQLLGERPVHTNPQMINQVSRIGHMFLLGDPPNYEPVKGEDLVSRARRMGVEPLDYAYDLLLEKDGAQLLYTPAANYGRYNFDAVRELMAHPGTVIALGDGGAHYGLVCDAGYPAYVLTRWVRDAPAGTGFSLAQAVRSLSRDPAQAVGLLDRGRLAPGYKADVNILDYPKLRLHVPRPVYDLPGGGRRLRQRADGFVATLVAGTVTYRDGVPTGALPGRLVRGARDVALAA